MKNVELYSETNPDIAFVVRFSDDDYKQGKELALEGFSLWCFQEPTKHLPDAEEWQDAGFAEPSMYLLDKAGIAYEILDWLDEEGELLPEYQNEDVEYISP